MIPDMKKRSGRTPVAKIADAIGVGIWVLVALVFDTIWIIPVAMVGHFLFGRMTEAWVRRAINDMLD